MVLAAPKTPLPLSPDRHLKVQEKMLNCKVILDTFFTGGDFAAAAVEQIATAVRRRTLAILGTIFGCLLLWLVLCLRLN